MHLAEPYGLMAQLRDIVLDQQTGRIQPNVHTVDVYMRTIVDGIESLECHLEPMDTLDIQFVWASSVLELCAAASGAKITMVWYRDVSLIPWSVMRDPQLWRWFSDASAGNDLLLVLVVLKAVTALILYTKFVKPDHYTSQWHKYS